MLGTGVAVKVALSALLASGAGVGAAAYAGDLPWGPQQPAAHQQHHSQQHRSQQHRSQQLHPHAKHAGTPVGPDATGPAAHGLCNAYAHMHAHGKAMGHSVAMRNLARAAGGAGKIPAYCATVPHPSESPGD